MIVEFIEPWMTKCNPDLILRLWRYKERPGKLTIVKYGITLRYVNTVFGELIVIIKRNIA